MELFEVKSEKFKPQNYETFLCLQYCKLIREQSKNSEEWKGHTTMKANECQYEENED